MYVQYELYIDIFFVENFIMDFFILVIIRKVMKCSVTYKRLCFGAIFGAFLSSFILCVPLPFVMKLVVLHTLVNVGMLMIGLSLRNIKSITMSVLYLYIISFLFGGVIEWINSTLNMYYRIGSLFIIIAAGSFPIIRKILDFLEEWFKVPEKYCEVTLVLGEHRCRLNALIDSGNHLFDHISNKPVHIINSEAIKKLTNQEKISMIRYIPYCTIHEEQGVLPIITIDKMYIHKENEKEIFSPLLGITSRDKFAGGSFEIILHPSDC